MNVEALTIGEAKQIAQMFNPQPPAAECPLPIGKQVIVRTVTHYYTGRLDQVVGGFLVLQNASWIADTGRWHTALATGTLNEVEPFIDPVYISIGAVVDVTIWRGELPRFQK